MACSMAFNFAFCSTDSLAVSLAVSALSNLMSDLISGFESGLLSTTCLDMLDLSVAFVAPDAVAGFATD